MRQLPLAQVKARLSAVIEEVESGHEIVVTRRGRPVARIVPERHGRRARPGPWIDELREFVARQPLSNGSSSVVAMRESEPY